MSLEELKLPSPKLILYVSPVLIVCVWLFLDFVIRDPSTILFALIALGSDILVRNLTSGIFTDRYWFVVVVVQSFFSIFYFFLPAVSFAALAIKKLKTKVISLVLIIWLVFYLMCLTFLFDLRTLLRFL
ncbi:MAG: hypothetical protein CMD52_04305 [Gammaproteobacteria bacterium]|nr:hypothetical protein [Gammaproteobacteria bacterium]|tara:strand:- start:426 stop:812 length:387 start_codon:yes stop_codon:yes gene_type:complete